MSAVASTSPATDRRSTDSAEKAIDLDLMRRIAERDSDAMRELYDRHAGLVYAIAMKVLHNRDDAADVTEDVFFELWDKASRFDASRASPSTYIVMLARSRAIDRARRKPREAAVSLEKTEEPLYASDGGTDNTPAGAAELGEQRTLVRQALEKLDPAQREVLSEAYFGGLSHSEIAEKLNKPLGTVKTYIRQGLIRLREQLRRSGSGTPE